MPLCSDLKQQSLAGSMPLFSNAFLYPSLSVQNTYFSRFGERSETDQLITVQSLNSEKRLWLGKEKKLKIAQALPSPMEEK